jgi:putative lipoprotein
MKGMIFGLFILMIIVLLSACDGEFSLTETPTVSGEVTNVENAPIPEGATLTVQIQDNSLQDVTSPVIGEQIIENPDQFPIPYEVGYDPDDIRSPNYTMSAQIRAADGSLLFTDNMNIPVITGGNPTEDVEIPVIQVGE